MTALPPLKKKNFLQNMADFWNRGTAQKIAILVAVGSICSCCGWLWMLGNSAPSTPALDPNIAMTDAILTAWAPFTQTAAALPTNTATPQNTPTPENTPTETPPPTATPAPITLTGSGDTILDIPDAGLPRILHAKYTSGRNFIVWGYDASNQPVDLLVNTVGTYEGKVPLDLLDSQYTSRLEIKASGPWEITLIPLAQGRQESIPGVIQGTGDDVIIILNPNDSADLISADASTASSNFIVQGYSNGEIDLLFNEIAPYTGTALLDRTTFLLVVKAEGNWSLNITTK